MPEETLRGDDHDEEELEPDSMMEGTTSDNDTLISTDGECEISSVRDKKYNYMNFSLTNARSLAPKLESLSTAFKELDLHFMMVTETWIKNSRVTTRNLMDYRNARNIGLICKNRRTRGGGVCVAFDNSRAKLGRFPLPASDFEIVCASGKLSGFTKKVAIFVVYLPPKMSVPEVGAACAYLADCIEKAKRELDDPYVCIGGDLNNKDISRALGDFPDIELLPNVPSRRGVALDLCYTNFCNEINQVTSHPPLATMDGTESDHLLLSYNFKVEKRHYFKTTERKSRRITEAGIEIFKGRILFIDWTILQGRGASEMVDLFDEMIMREYNQCFPEHTIKTRSTDLPWITRRIKRRIRRKKRMYRRVGKSQEWKELERDISRDVSDNMVRHLDKVKERIYQGGNVSTYYQTINMLQQERKQEKWSPLHLFPDLGEREVAERCADFFNGISSEFQQIRAPQAPQDQDRLPAPEVFQIAGRLRCMKKPKSIVPGDIDGRVVTACSDILAFPLSMIFAEVFSSCSWPRKWKTETVTIIPKNSAPSGLSETRNLSCTPLYSKLLESFLLEELRKVVKLNNTQFGGIKGLGVDHFLIETWDEILRAVDSGGKVVNLMSIDFQKAFNRMDHQTCLDRLKVKGAGEHLVQLVAAFLFKRTMTVKAGDERSEARIVNGGAPQGSILGPFLFCVVSEILAEAVPRTDFAAHCPRTESEDDSQNGEPGNSEEESLDQSAYDSSEEEWAAVESEFNFFRKRKKNPLDDTVASEFEYQREEEHEGISTVPTVKAYIDDFNIIEVIDTSKARLHITTAKTFLSAWAEHSEKIFDNISAEAEQIKMLVNARKTQLLCVDNNPNVVSRTFIRPRGVKIGSSDKLKILGFVFGVRPTCEAQVGYLLEKYRGRLWSLRKLAANGLSREDLLRFYTTNMRSIFEYTQVTYHTMITKEQSGLLESAQSRALKIIHGTEYSYENLLRQTGLSRVEDRRKAAFEKFTVKAANNEIINHKWFPLNEAALHDTRTRNVYLEEMARTEKLYRSPIFEMRRLLNSL